MSHRTTYEDDKFAGVMCAGVVVDLSLDAESPEWRECPRCGRELRLQWDVTVLERAKS